MSSDHILYRTGDIGTPKSICDSNGEVVLGLCKRCNRAEIELDEPCVIERPVPNDTVLWLVTDESGNHPVPALFNSYTEACGFCETFSIGGKTYTHKRVQVGMMEMRNGGWGLFD